jgi:glyoxylase-like metal-dependent hydrolase (beta-lactamase superfamily II)
MVGTSWDNVTAISTQKGIVVIDAGISYSLTAEYRKAIEKRFNRNDFAYLINTHPHHDHTRGNPVFSDAVIVGHSSFLTEIPVIWKDPARVKSWASESIAYHQALLDSLTKDSPEWKEALCNKTIYKHLLRDASGEPDYAVPELTFDDTLTLHAGDVTFSLLHFGRAHSNADVIIHIPEKKILFVGDLFSTYGKVNFHDVERTDAERWLPALDWIEARMNAIDIIVGGHGAILSIYDLQSFNERVRKKYKEIN